jgi:glucosamine 6-phosphate synthetase-like amidotransferase/phosphosugar isomerase protein
VRTPNGGEYAIFVFAFFMRKLSTYRRFCFKSSNGIVDSVSIWVINSGTSVHASFARNIFCSYISDEFVEVKLAHESVLKCVGLEDG